jgi:hypothetical protein
MVTIVPIADTRDEQIRLMLLKFAITEVFGLCRIFVKNRSNIIFNIH